MPGVLKNAIDGASRPRGPNSFAHKPSGDRRLPGQDRKGCRPAECAQCAELLRFAADGAPEAYIQLTPGLITEVGEVTDKGTEQFLRDLIEAFEVFVTRVLTALPPERVRATGDDGAGPRT